MVIDINTAGLAEGGISGAALGHDLTILCEVLSQTGANSRVLQTDGEDMPKRDHSCFFFAGYAAWDGGHLHCLECLVQGSGTQPAARDCVRKSLR